MVNKISSIHDGSDGNDDDNDDDDSLKATMELEQ